MKKFLSIVIAALSVMLIVEDADAASRRFGGGGNVGKQRSGVTQQQAAPKAPAQATPATPRSSPPGCRSGWDRWPGSLSGLASHRSFSITALAARSPAC
jgi:hypothetical protein